MQLTIKAIKDALNTAKSWTIPDSYEAKILALAVDKGYVRRLGPTRYEFTREDRILAELEIPKATVEDYLRLDPEYKQIKAKVKEIEEKGIEEYNKSIETIKSTLRTVKAEAFKFNLTDKELFINYEGVSLPLITVSFNSSSGPNHFIFRPTISLPPITVYPQSVDNALEFYRVVGYLLNELKLNGPFFRVLEDIVRDYLSPSKEIRELNKLLYDKERAYEQIVRENNYEALLDWLTPGLMLKNGDPSSSVWYKIHKSNLNNLKIKSFVLAPEYSYEDYRTVFKPRNYIDNGYKVVQKDEGSLLKWLKDKKITLPNTYVEL